MNVNASTSLILSISLAFVGCSSNRGTETTAQGGSSPTYNVSNDAGVGVHTYNGGTQKITIPQYLALTQASCSGWSRQGESVPTSIEFVVDTSGSMLSTAPTTGSQSKWDITQTALASAIDAMPSTTAVGMLFYPNQVTVPNTSGEAQPIETCVKIDAMIPLATLGAVNSLQRKALAQGLESAVIAGGTPTHDAYDYALFQGLKPSDQPGHRYMVLITDGQPTISMDCIGTGETKYPVDYQPIIAEITTAHAAGVATFVIGAPGSEKNSITNEDTRYWLSAAARAGGTSVSDGCSDTGSPAFCHFDMSEEPDFAAGFGKALASIAAQVSSCSYTVPAPSSGQTLDLDKVNVILTESTSDYYLVLRAESSDCTSGWYYDVQGNIVLCSETCAQVRADGLAALELRFGCATLANPLT